MIKSVFSVLLLLVAFCAAQSHSDADIAGPTLLSLQVSATTIDLSAGAQTIEFTIQAEDDSGIQWGGGGAFLALDSPGGVSKYVYFSETEPHTGELTLDPDEPSGLWPIRVVYLKDTLGNTGYYNRTALDALGVPQSIEVTGGGSDFEGPVLQSLNISPTSIDLSAGAQTIEFTIQAEDDSGIQWGGGGAFLALDSPGGVSKYVYFSETEPHTGELTLDPDEPSGLWPIRVVYLKDTLGNTGYYNRTALDALGVPSFFTVIYDSSNEPDLVVAKVSSPDYVFEGDKYSQTIIITNSSQNPSGEISLKITSNGSIVSQVSPSGGATACSIQSSSPPTNSRGACKLSGLQPMESREVSLAMTAGYNDSAQLLVEAYTELPDSNYIDNLLNLTTTVLGNEITVPQPPVITSVEIEDGALLVRFSPDGDGGSEIISYTLSCDESSVTKVQSPIRVSNLENDFIYICSVTASNLLGNSSASESVSAAPQESIRSGLNIILLKAAMDAKSKAQELN